MLLISAVATDQPSKDGTQGILCIYFWLCIQTRNSPNILRILPCMQFIINICDGTQKQNIRFRSFCCQIIRKNMLHDAIFI